MALFKNDPSTDTAISAAELNRLESYATASAGSDGDFHVTFTGASALATNDYIEIRFPAATTSADNARVSIDGGSTYMNVKSLEARQLLASEIEDRRLRLYYDGTNFIAMNNSTLSATGSTQIESGLIIKWGILTSDDSIGSNSTTVTFTDAFPNACVGAWVNCSDPGYGVTNDVLGVAYIASYTTANMSLMRKWSVDPGSLDYTWIAIGY